MKSRLSRRALRPIDARDVRDRTDHSRAAARDAHRPMNVPDARRMESGAQAALPASCNTARPEAVPASCKTASPMRALTIGERASDRTDRPQRQLGPVHTMFANALHCGNGTARGVKAKAGWAPGELSQRRAAPFSQQPGGNGRHGPPLCVALHAKTASLCFVERLDWRALPPVRIREHSLNRP